MPVWCSLPFRIMVQPVSGKSRLWSQPTALRRQVSSVLHQPRILNSPKEGKPAEETSTTWQHNKENIQNPLYSVSAACFTGCWQAAKLTGAACSGHRRKQQGLVGGSGSVHGLYGLIQHLNFQECYIFCENSCSSFLTLVPPVPVKDRGDGSAYRWCTGKISFTISELPRFLQKFPVEV